MTQTIDLNHGHRLLLNVNLDQNANDFIEFEPKSTPNYELATYPILVAALFELYGVSFYGMDWIIIYGVINH